jgi:lipopolysaccharide export LptBFGC system permease protein LptF
VGTLSRHLLARQLSLFASALLALFAIAAATEMLVHLDEIVEQRAAAGGALPWLLLRVAARYGGDAVPVASFAATFLCVGLAARSGETTALGACGVAPGRVAARLLLAAGTLSVAALLFNETWLLDAQRAVARLGSSSPDESGRGPFWYHSGGVLYNAAERAADGTLRDVAIFELDGRGRLRGATRATRARPEAGRWRLAGAEQRAFDPDAPAGSRPQPAADTAPAVPLRRAAPAGAAGPPRSLAELAAGSRAGDRRQHVALHARLARPAGVLVFALLALPLGLGVPRGGSLARPALLGAAALALYQGVDATALLGAEHGLLPAWLGGWLALLLLALGSAAALARSPR